MNYAALMAILVFAVPSCSQSEVATTNSCATELIPSYNPKALDQCIAVCKKCEHGVTTTCTTSCTLKGAH
jgi:hypothetical protein